MRTRSVFAILALVSAVPLFAPRPCAAWKPYTHDYSAEQVRSDVLAGSKVTILGRQYPLDPAVAAALRDWPQFYYAGAIGPDGFPDLTFGQAVIHPVDTGKWLQHLYSRAWAAQSDPSYTPAERSQILAFTYGFMTHAAGDVWGHTLINDFADPSHTLGVFPAVGDILTSVPMAGIAVRHIIAEGYVGDATPGYDANPDRGPAPNGDVSDDSTPGFALDVPHRFIYETLINPAAQTPVPAFRGNYGEARGPIIGFFLDMRDGLQDFVAYDPDPLQDAINAYDDTVEALMMVECACNFGANVSDCSNSCCWLPIIGCVDDSDFCDGLHDVVACPAALLELGFTVVIDTFEAFLAFMAGTAEELALAVLDSYVAAWIDDINAGLANWSRLGLATTRGLFDPQARRDLQNEECHTLGGEGSTLRAECEDGIGTLDVVLAQADPFINDHLLSMVGLPDFVGEVRRIVSEVMDVLEEILAYVLMPFNPVREALADLKAFVKDLITEAISSVIGIDIEALGDFLKEPSRWMCMTETPFLLPPPLGSVTLGLFPTGYQDRLEGILALAPGHHASDPGLPESCSRLTDATVFDPAVFPPMKNTITMAKLLLLDGPQVDQVLTDILGRTISTYGPGDNIMTKTLDGSPEWLRLIDGDHAWRENGAPVFGPRDEKLTGGTGQFPPCESCVLRSAFGTLFKDWENGDQPFPDLGDAVSADVVNDPSAPASALARTGVFYDDGLHRFVAADNVFTHTAHDGPPGFAYPDDQLELQHRTYLVPGLPGDFVTTGQSATFSLTGTDGVYRIEVRSGDRCHTVAEGDALTPEATQTSEYVLDATAPVTTCNAPPFGRVFDTDDLSAVDYLISDGALGSGVASSSATLDGYRTAGGITPVSNGASLDMYLLWPGTRTVAVSTADHLGNAGVSACTFTIRPTPTSMLANVDRALSEGLIKNGGLANSLQAKLRSAEAAAARGQCNAARNVLNAFIHELEAQGGKGVQAGIADRLIAYARDLLLHGDPRCGSDLSGTPAGEGAR